MRRIWAGLALLGALAFAMGSADAQGGSLAGTWNGAATLNGATYYTTVVFQPNGQFSEQTRMGTLMTLTTGTYEWIDRNTFHMTPRDWEPKQQCFPQSGCHEIRMPPGTMMRVTFTSPDTISLRDLNFGGTVVYQRAQ